MFILSEKDSVGTIYLNELRSVEIQQDRLRFRRNMERIGEILAYEISKTFDYKKLVVKTPLGESHSKELVSEPVLATVLRAGLPFHQGFLNIFDKAENAFIASFRKVMTEDGHFEIVTEYTTSPSLDGKKLILCDPMLASGQSLLAAYEALLKFGKPESIHIASIIASRQGVDFLSGKIKSCKFWLGAIDETLNKKSYIVPGLGDAGDLAFGEKI